MTDRIRKWLSYRELRQARAGHTKGLEPVDVAAVVEGQAEQAMRGYAQKLHWWELDEGQDLK